MKNILLVLIPFIFSSFSLAGTKTKNHSDIKDAKKFSQYICKQKTLPLSVEYLIKEDTISVEIKAEADLKSFNIEAARGVDGLKVLNFEKGDTKDLIAGSTHASSYRFIRSPGRSYFVLDLVALVDGKKKYQIVSIPFGKFNKSQINKMRKNLSIVDSQTPGEDKDVEKIKTMKLHRMKQKQKNPK
jgi:hypothetical protein